jgi:hypothetical protein
MGICIMVLAPGGSPPVEIGGGCMNLSPGLSFGTTTLNEIIDLAVFRGAYGTTFV